MPKWARGEAEIEQLLARGELERVTGAAADGTPLLDQARKTAATAAGLVSSDAYSAYVLAYDSARFACIALLAQQGLRATTSGGHYAVEQAVRAQFGDGFRPFGTLRRRRNELEYPHLPSDAATSEEAEQAAGTAQMTYHRRGQATSPTVLLQPRPGVTDHWATGNASRHRACHVAVPWPNRLHRKLVLSENRLNGTACEPPTFPRSGTPVTNQVTTTPDSQGHRDSRGARRPAVDRQRATCPAALRPDHRAGAGGRGRR